MTQVKKVVLAYSGGVDTSVCIPYLKHEYGIKEVITFAADLGQGDELEPIRKKALDAGASHSLVGDLIKPFVHEFAFVEWHKGAVLSIVKHDEFDCNEKIVNVSHKTNVSPSFLENIWTIENLKV